MIENHDSIEESTPGRNKFFVVGIGASAGGIQALKEFFEHVPSDSGMAYVVILHLSPDHDSHLTQLLQAITPLPVTQVTEKVRVQPNAVYVVPPNQHLLMENDHITVSANTLIEERRAPVDIFFRTLAESHKTHAVAVVLSGTGANGSMGLKRIKEKGGAVFVQNPREAEFSEMPRNSIATEMVDEVLPVADIPQKIISYQQSQEVIRIPLEITHQPQDQQQALREIFTQLRLRTGHDFSNYKRPTLLRRIERRISIHDLPDLPAYSAYVQQHPDEINSLLKDLLISVTNFFRDRKAFEELETEVLPVIFQGKSSADQVRIWIAGCATGEEAYSIAILCAERTMHVLDSPKVQIFATDIDEAAIAAARDGLYTLNDAADVSPERLRRFFTKEGESYRIRREIREMVLFASHNFLKDPPFSHLHLITCRNVLIYLNHTAQERVMETFHFALNPGGFLFLGTSESADSATDLYNTFSREHHIFQSRQAANRSYPVPESVPSFRTYEQPAIMPAVPELPSRSLDRITYGDLHQRLLEQYAPPSMVVNEEYDIVHLSERAGRYLQIAGGELSRNLLKLIRQELRLELRSALYQATQRQTPVEIRGLQVGMEDSTETVNIQVRPVLREGDVARGFILVIISPAEPGAAEEVFYSSEEPVARHLEEELMRLKAQLRSSNEQHEFQAEELKAANEELQAMNEELRSAAEELETSKEELQSINEELTTVNQELKVKVEEVSMSGNNLQNLINSTDLGTIFLDRSFRVLLFTPSTRNIFNLIPTDHGRPLSDITSKLLYDSIIADAELVLQRLQAVEQEVHTTDNNIYLMRILPYRTVEDRIQGVVITFIDITERTKAEEELRQAEEKYLLQLEEEVVARTAELKTNQQHYQSLVENTPDIIIRWDKELKLVYANNALEKKIGLSNKQVLGKTKMELGQPAEVAVPYMDCLQKVFMSGEAAEHFNTLSASQGSFQLFTRMVPEKNEQGEVETVLTIARDITDIRKAEEEITTGRNLLQATVDSSVDMIQVFDAVRNERGEIVDFTWKLNNHSAQKAYGDVIGKSLLENNPGVAATSIFDTFKQVVETGVSNEQERHYQYEQFDGWFYQSVVKLGDGVTTTTSDITERKRAEQEILQLKDEVAQKATDKYYSLFNSIDEGFEILELIYDENGKAVDFYYIETNPAFERHTGLINIKGKLGKEVSPNIEAYWFEAYDNVVKTGKPIRTENYNAFTQRWYESYASRVGNTSSRQLAIVFNDITERKNAERKQTFLLKLSDAVGPLLNATDIQATVTSVAMDFFKADRCYYCEIEGDIATIRQDAHQENLTSVAHIYKMSEMPVFKAMLEVQQPIVVADSAITDVMDDNLRKLCLEASILAYINVPVIKDNKLVGALCVTQSTPRVWTNFEINLAKEIAERTWLAVERTRVEILLRLREAELAHTQEIGHIGGVNIDVANGLTSHRSPEYIKLHGLPPDTKVETHEDWLKRLHPDDREKAEQTLFNALQGTATAYESEYRIIRPSDGQLRWIYAKLNIERDVVGKPVRLVGLHIDLTDRKKAERALRESEKRFQSIANLMPDLLWESEPDGSTSWYNQRWLEYTGQSFEEAINWGWTDAIHPDDRESSVKRYDEAVKTGNPLWQEHRIQRYDGQYRWFVVNSLPLKNENGHVVKMYGSATDIHDRKLTEEALRESELRLRTLIQNLPGAAVFIVDKDLRYQVAEGEALLQAGFKSADLVGKTLAEAIPEGAAEREGYYKKALAGEAFNIEHQEHNHTYISRGTPLRNAAGEVYAVLAISYDISDRQKAEETLRLAEERYRTVLESAEMGAWDWNIGEDKVVWNPKHYEMLGADPNHQPMDSSFFLQFIHPEDASRVKDNLFEAINTKGVYHTEFRIIRADNGEVRWMDGFGRVADIKENTATRMVGVMSDITDRRRLEQQREEFIGIASHELKTPVTSIKAYAQVLQEMFEQSADSKSAGLMKKLDTQVDRLTRLIQDLLDTTKIAEGQLSLRKEQFSIDELIGEHIEQWQRLSNRHRLIWHPTSGCMVQADKERIEQVLTNFVSNAIKYSPGGGDVVIQCQSKGKEIELSIQDHGVGIAKEVQDKVFDRFFRVKDPQLQTFPGLGLGLYISAGIIKRHNGTIRVESTLGEGSTFIFTLPKD